MNLASFWHGLAREFRLGARGAWWQESASRVLRGGSWNNNNRDNVLSSNRNNNDPDNRIENIGFRAVVEAGSGRKRNLSLTADHSDKTDKASISSLLSALISEIRGMPNLVTQRLVPPAWAG